MDSACYFSLENEEVVRLLAHRLDNPTLESLSHTIIWRLIADNKPCSDWFWYLRTQTLVSRDLLQRRGDWKTAYYLLETSLIEDNPFTLGALSNLIATSVLLEVGYDPTADDNSSIRYAAQHCHIEVVRLLLADERVDPSSIDNYAIRTAAYNGHIEITRLLLADERVDPTADDNYAICMAAQSGHTEVIRLLLADGRADPSSRDNYATRMAAYNGHTEVVRLLNENL